MQPIRPPLHRLRAPVLALVVLIAFSMSLATTPVRAQPVPMFPLLNCVEPDPNEPGMLVTHWGYINPNDNEVQQIPGFDNMFEPGKISRGQPVLFQPGRHDEVFSVTIEADTALTWILTDNEITASIESTPCQVPGISVNPSSGLTTDEGGGVDAFTVVLDSRPTDDVTIPVSSDDTSEGKVTPPSLTFTPGNWNLGQAVIVTGQDDLIDDGDIAFNLVTGPASSADPNYNGTDLADVGVTNVDDDDQTVDDVFDDRFESP